MAGESNLNLSPFLLLLLIPLIFLILKHLTQIVSSRPPLPPGPQPWPLIGNLLHMVKKPHIKLTELTQTHGPLISLRLGTQLLVVGSSPYTASEILKSHDRILSARHVPKVSPVPGPELEHRSLVWQSECGDRWKVLRTICRTGLFSPKAIDGQSPIREKKVMEMVEYLAAKEGEVVNVAEAVFATVFNILGNLLLSKDFIDLEDERAAGGLKGLIWRMMELGSTPNISDFYPILAGLDLQGLKKKAWKCTRSMFAVWEVLLKERRQGRDGNASRRQDFLDVLLDNDFSDDQINSLILELFTAGTDTSTTTVEWAMAELIKNPEVMNNVRKELESKIKEKVIRESDLPVLPYSQACVKETLRLHPPVPLLLPHRASENCKIMGYGIPKDTPVQVNVWAIGREPTTWTNPLAFTPERFLISELDYKGNHFEFIPFGAGRRICPGLPMATRLVHFILACLIHNFEWSLPSEMNPIVLDMDEKFGVTLQKKEPLFLIPTVRR
ncbi:(S)-N-methylcoclaurine 3'-hydroxylase isozyme 1-like [Aristolochia californica]|uniref:(S)-N-methylcoclaurine 3'-hydroxylase isozyme 1-like n=1 Tax=Aristolochia californica TaxID=171875 RepID=UPI0035D94210